MASNINNSLNYASTSYVFQDVSFESSTTTNMTMTTATPEGRGFVAGFVASISVILVSELGDKTFFIAALMAMRNGRIMVFSGALAALASMTILSALGGKLVTQIIPRDYTFYISAALFFIFGMKMVHEGYMMSPDEAKEEMEEAQQEIAQHQQPARQNQRQQNLRPDETDVTVNFVNNNDAELADNMGGDVESGSAVSSASRVSPIEGALSDTTAGTPTPPAPRQNAQETPPCERLTKALCNFFRRRVLLSAMGVSLSSAFFQAFTLTFVAEWGDRSQLATIALASREDVGGVIVGGILGHALCTGSAVIGGRLLASKISVRHVTLLGGLVFIVFAFVAIGMGPD